MNLFALGLSVASSVAGLCFGAAIVYTTNRLRYGWNKPIPTAETPILETHIETFSELLVRANMARKYHTSVVRATGGEARVAVTSGRQPWGDCISLEWMDEKKPGIWYFAHFSPARARVIAKFLIDAAERYEKSDPGMKCIDKEKEANDQA